MKATDLLEKEHRKIESLLASRVPADPASAREFLARLEVELDLHTETDLFPKAEQRLSPERLETLGRHLREYKRSLTRLLPRRRSA
jgi:glycine cleavage system regulatory protein